MVVASDSKSEGYGFDPHSPPIFFIYLPVSQSIKPYFKTKKPNGYKKKLNKKERNVGIEPTTPGFAVLCSTTELIPQDEE